MTRPLPQLRAGRDGPEQAVKLINEMRRLFYRGPGVSICPASEAIAAFSCVTFDQDDGTVVLARADGNIYASGVIVNDVEAGEIAVVISIGLIEGAVTGRSNNDPVWVGLDGTLVFAAPAGYVQPIGTCVHDGEALFVHVESPVI